MKEFIMDRGGEFGAHRTDENGNWEGEKLKRYLEGLEIYPIYDKKATSADEWGHREMV